MFVDKCTIRFLIKFLRSMLKYNLVKFLDFNNQSNFFQLKARRAFIFEMHMSAKL